MNALTNKKAAALSRLSGSWPHAMTAFGLAGLIAILSTSPARGNDPAAGPSTPNVVFILADDKQQHALGEWTESPQITRKSGHLRPTTDYGRFR